MHVKTDRLNLRSEPVVKPETVIASLPLAHPVTVLGNASREGWKEVEVNLEGSVLEGVVSGRYLREMESDAKEALLRETVAEWLRFNRGAGREEEEPFFEFIGEMWQSLGINLDGRDADVPWSAAFISHVVRRAGYQGFSFAAAHARYIHDAIVKRQNGETGSPFWGFRPQEHRPQLGDLVCQWRNHRRTFDEAAQMAWFQSHCDVVVELRDTFVRAIGGNVGNSVRMKTFSLDSAGFLKATTQSRVFAVLRNNL